MLPENRLPTHPGEVLREEFLIPLDVSRSALARHLGVPARRISQIVREKRSITPELAWLLSQAFATTPVFWMNLQMAYDLARNKPKQPVERLAVTA